MLRSINWCNKSLVYPRLYRGTGFLNSQYGIENTLKISTCSILSSQKKENSNQSYNKNFDLVDFPPEKIRNFSIIAHIDHGKSTLADRLLEITGTIKERDGNKQVLDKLKVERERGITVKAQTVSMFYKYKGEEYLLNLIDTPGHVDFSYEVTRSLSACQGSLLLVDATQGIQSQTVSNFYLAYGQDLTILPVINKMDLPAANPEAVSEEIETVFEIDRESISMISAKNGKNCQELLPKIIDQIPAPTGDKDLKLKALLFDSWYDTYVGVICLVNVLQGTLRMGEELVTLSNMKRYQVTQLGILNPDKKPVEKLYPGQVGYIVLGMKNARDAHIGDTLFKYGDSAPSPLPGFSRSNPMVFAGIFPVSSSEFTQLEEAIDRLVLNDASVTFQRQTSLALGQGWRLGFLGTLHLDVFKQRLEEEFNSAVIVTSPSVPYKVVYKDGTEKVIRTPMDFPEPHELHNQVEKLLEPYVRATLIFPSEYIGDVIQLCMDYRGEDPNPTFIDSKRVLVKCDLPLAEIVTDFYDALKSKTSGYSSFDYEEIGYRKSNLVKMTILLNSNPVDVLTTVTHKSRVERLGRDLCQRLKEVIDKQLFEVVIQAAVSKKVIARETIPAMRKNVTAKCYGGDVSRKMKLLAKQKEGKKKLKMIGNVQVPHEAFLSVMAKKE